MSPFGWGILLGGFGAATVLGFYHRGLVTPAVLATLAWAILLTAIPNHWVGMGRKCKD
jgi:hypothetical protein